ncbi:hypothetical protein TWF225_008601 [Orbilia oligospora]|nr:hypothetical protein TWF225_008601 [Orbilia oligospora]KAF3239611.1 hypothetical protein TWF128_011718 [Orbilia oligospora]KAF3255428.1 hypothetical protein TWF217_006599 [Orbilia oligospora]KAF3295733.1 hypothetical protein TWF132_001055 [Orbilia oligospora]
MVRSRLVRLAPAHRREKSTFKYFGRPPQSKPKIAWQKRGSHKSNFRGIQIARGGYIQANRLQKRKMNRTPTRARDFVHTSMHLTPFKHPERCIPFIQKPICISET